MISTGHFTSAQIICLAMTLCYLVESFQLIFMALRGGRNSSLVQNRNSEFSLFSPCPLPLSMKTLSFKCYFYNLPLLVWVCNWLLHSSIQPWISYNPTSYLCCIMYLHYSVSGHIKSKDSGEIFICSTVYNLCPFLNICGITTSKLKKYIRIY